LFGRIALPGYDKATYGTGSSIMMNIGKIPKMHLKGWLLGRFRKGKSIDYVFEGNIIARRYHQLAGQ
jgi:glycerol kinase